jgi:arsenite/tail-anchored protein-transporting ATPase
VLIISTDPAHNLSDAFDQKFGAKPSLVNGFQNLYALEIDPKEGQDKGGLGGLGALFGGDGGSSAMEGLTEDQQAQSKGFLQEIMGSIPGIDEASSFGAIMKSLDEYKFDLIIFDTAPTGHTLRLLDFPRILDKGIKKLIELKERFGGMLTSMQGMMGG